MSVREAKPAEWYRLSLADVFFAFLPHYGSLRSLVPGWDLIPFVLKMGQVFNRCGLKQCTVLSLEKCALKKFEVYRFLHFVPLA